MAQIFFATQIALEGSTEQIFGLNRLNFFNILPPPLPIHANFIFDFFG